MYLFALLSHHIFTWVDRSFFSSLSHYCKSEDENCFHQNLLIFYILLKTKLSRWNIRTPYPLLRTGFTSLSEIDILDWVMFWCREVCDLQCLAAFSASTHQKPVGFLSCDYAKYIEMLPSILWRAKSPLTVNHFLRLRLYGQFKWQIWTNLIHLLCSKRKKARRDRKSDYTRT
jgi:hypothetical protein